MVVLLLLGRVAHADEPRWPIRLNVAMPFGYTAGHEALHGFTWGFRAAATVHPARDGLAVGGYAEMLLDADTDALDSFGVTAAYPLIRHDDCCFEWRAGLSAAVRTSDSDNDKRGVFGVSTHVAMPFYLYELRVGVRFEATEHRGSLSAESVLIDVDLLAIAGIFGLAGGIK